MQKLRNFSKKIKAFTITELVIVIAVIAILASVLIPTFTGVIEKANVSADIQELHSVNVQLALQEEPITDEEGLKSVINSVFGETFYDSMSPRSEKYGYHYWYDVKNNKIVLGTYDEILAGTSASVSDNVVYADNAPEIIAENPVVEIAISSQNKFLPNSFRSIISGYYLLDRVGAMASAIDAVEALTALTEENETTGGAYFSVINALTSTKAGSKDLNFATAILNKLSTTAIVTEAGTFRFQNVKEVTSLVFAKNITKISSSVYVYNGESVVKEYLRETNFIANVSNIALPSTVQKVASGALYFGGETAHTSALLITDLEEGDLSSVFSVSSTNATILAKKQGQNTASTEYVLIGKNVVEKESGNVVGGVEYSNKVTQFDIITPNSVAGKLATVGTTLYIAYDYANSFVLTTDNFNVDASSTKINWSVSANDFLTVNENGEVSITALPAVNACTATITATPEAGGIEKTLTVYVVRPNVSSLKLGDADLVNLIEDNHTIIYYGEVNTYDFTDAIITNNSINKENSSEKLVACDAVLSITTEENGNVFSIAKVENGSNVIATLTLKDLQTLENLTQNVTIKLSNADGSIVYYERTFAITVNDQSAKEFTAKFESSGDYLYRVSNRAPITLGSLFSNERAPKTSTLAIYDVLKEAGGGMYAPITQSGKVDGSEFWAEFSSEIQGENWENATVTFHGTGIAKVVLAEVVAIIEVVNDNVEAGKATSYLAPTVSLEINAGAEQNANDAYYTYNEAEKTIKVGFHEGESYTAEIIKEFTASKYSGRDLAVVACISSEELDIKDEEISKSYTFTRTGEYKIVFKVTDALFYNGAGVLQSNLGTNVIIHETLTVIVENSSYNFDLNVSVPTTHPYRVESGEEISLSTLFANQKAHTKVTATVEAVSEYEGFTWELSNGDLTCENWQNATVTFNGAGVAKITVNGVSIIIEALTAQTNESPLKAQLNYEFNSVEKGSGDEYCYVENEVVKVGLIEGRADNYEIAVNTLISGLSVTKYTGQTINVVAKLYKNGAVVENAVSGDFTNGFVVSVKEIGAYTLEFSVSNDVYYNASGSKVEMPEYALNKALTINVEYSVTAFTVKEEVAKRAQKFVFRVGNKNEVKLGSLFDNATNPKNYTIEVRQETGSGSNPAEDEINLTDWRLSTIKFNVTNLYRIMLNCVGSEITTELLVEVVEAYNVTTYSELKNQNSVLLNDITMSSGGEYYISNATLYGNGFTFDVRDGAYNGSGYITSNYLIGLQNAILDNIQVIGKVYMEYGATVDANYNRAIVLSSGNSAIYNSYISNGCAPVRVHSGNLEVVNTTLKGGNFANLDIRGGNIVLDNVTTINQVNGNDKASDGSLVFGFGVVIYQSSEAIITIKNGLTQYNNISKKQTEVLVGDAKTLATQAFKQTDLLYNDGSTDWLNTGIFSMTENFDGDNLIGSDLIAKVVSYSGYNGYIWSKIPTAESIVVIPNEWAAEKQGVIAPSYTFDYTTKNYVAKTDGSNDYCYYDNGTVLISMDQGDTFNWDTSILNATKNGKILHYTVTMNGTDYAGKSIAFNTEGEYTVSYIYTDNDNFAYDSLNKTYITYPIVYTKIIKINVAVVKPNAKNAVFTFYGGTNASKVGVSAKYVTIGNEIYVMPNVSATISNEIGSTTVSGQTIYYPIVDSIKVGKITGWYVVYPVFNGVLDIVDYIDGGTGAAIKYDYTTTVMPSGLSAVDPANSFKFQSGNQAPTTPQVYNNNLVYTSVQGVFDMGNPRTSDFTEVVKFRYTDNTGSTYYYYVGYRGYKTTNLFGKVIGLGTTGSFVH